MWYRGSHISTETIGDTYKQGESKIEVGEVRKQIDVSLHHLLQRCSIMTCQNLQVSVRGHRQHIRQWLAKAALMGVGQLKLVECHRPRPRKDRYIYQGPQIILSVDCDAFGLTANVSGIKGPGNPLTVRAVMRFWNTWACIPSSVLIQLQCPLISSWIQPFPESINVWYRMRQLCQGNSPSLFLFSLLSIPNLSVSTGSVNSDYDHYGHSHMM
jgi:hypothetical protein